MRGPRIHRSNGELGYSRLLNLWKHKIRKSIAVMRKHDLDDKSALREVKYQSTIRGSRPDGAFISQMAAKRNGWLDNTSLAITVSRESCNSPPPPPPNTHTCMHTS
jgi:hypothetical protein